MNQNQEAMITDGLTASDLKTIDMDLDELKDYRNDIRNETPELEAALVAIENDPGLISAETILVVDAYFKKWNPEGFEF